MGFQAFFIDRFQAQEHVLEPEPPPVAEHFLVANQDIGAGLKVVLLFDLALFQLGTDREAMLGMDESNIVNDEDVGFFDRGHVVRGRFRRRLAVTAAIEGPGAAKRTIPRAPARELDRGARIEHANKYLLRRRPRSRAGKY